MCCCYGEQHLDDREKVRGQLRPTGNQTNLQRERELTALLVDPTALMDESGIDDQNRPTSTDTKKTAEDGTKHAATHLQLLDDFKQLCLLTEEETQRRRGTG